MPLLQRTFRISMARQGFSVLEKIVENLLRWFLLSSTVLGGRISTLWKFTAAGSQFSIFKVDTKLGIFPLLITKYLQYIPQPTLRGHTMAEKLVLLDLTIPSPGPYRHWPPLSTCHSFPYSASSLSFWMVLTFQDFSVWTSMTLSVCVA